MKRDRIIYELWRLLDNIDTASDVYKYNYKALAEYVYKERQKSHQLLTEKQVKKMYDKYFKWEGR